MRKIRKINKKKIVLIHPSAEAPPFGIMSIYSFLKKNGKCVRIVAYTKKDIPSKRILNDIKGADIIGISVYTMPMIKQACRITRIIKKQFVGFLFWGGVHSTLFPKESIKEMNLDAVAINEGEITLLELVDSLENKKPLRKVKGLYLKEGNKIIFTGYRTPINDLSIIPMYDWEAINIKDYVTKNLFTGRYAITLVEGRGCSFNCAYCYVNKMFGGKWRGREPDEVTSELKMLNKKYNISHFDFYDDILFGGHKQKMIYFCKMLSKLNFTWSCDFRVNFVNEDIIRAMKVAGCKYIYFGVESGSPRMLKKLNRQTPIPIIINAFDICNKVGITTTAGFIAGFPRETVGDLKLTFKLMKRLKPTRTRVVKYVPYPGGKLYEEAIKKGLKLPKHAEEFAYFGSYSNDNINLSTIPNKILKKVRRKARYISIKNTILFAFKHKQFDILPYYLLGSLHITIQKPLLFFLRFITKPLRK